MQGKRSVAEMEGVKGHRSLGGSAKSAPGSQPVKKQEPHSYNSKKLESANNLDEPGLADALTLVL